jgi:plastocyanin domain-containing protein
VSVSQYVVTAVGLTAIVGVLWYFLFSKGSQALAPTVAGVQEVRFRRHPSSSHQERRANSASAAA